MAERERLELVSVLRLGENIKLLLLKHRNTGCGYLTSLGIASFLGGQWGGWWEEKD